jgi:hypothetical protein
MGSKKVCHQPACMAAHDLINKLAAIVGHCDLLNEMTEQGTKSAKTIAVIRDIAESSIKELREHQREIEANNQKAG